MGYDVIDLIDKAISIAVKRKELYQGIGDKEHKSSKVAVAANVLIRHIEKTIAYYEQLKLEAKHDYREEIDFATYDKISFLTNEFGRRIISPNINDVKNLLEFALDFEKQVIALYIDIQGRLIKTEEDTNRIAYKILSSIIEEKKENIQNLQMFIRD